MATQQDTISLGYGIRRTPSLGDGGELSECVNLIPHGGELVNIQPPKQVDVDLPQNCKLLFIHETTRYRHYILQQLVLSSDGRKYVAPKVTSTTISTTASFQETFTYRVYITNAMDGVELKVTRLSSASSFTPTTLYVDVDVTFKDGSTEDIELSISSTDDGYPYDTTITGLEHYDYTDNPIQSAKVTSSSLTELCRGVYVTNPPDEKEDEPVTDTDEEFFILTESIKKIVAMGNTLIVSTDDGIGYYLWRDEDAKYIYLGQDIPKLQIQFALDGELKTRGGSTTIKTSDSDTDYSIDDCDEILQNFTNYLGKGYTKFWVTTDKIEKGKPYRIKNNSSKCVKVKLYVNKDRKRTYTIGAGKYADFTAGKAYNRVGIGNNNGGKGFQANVQLYKRSEITFKGFDNTVGNLNAILGQANKFVGKAMTDDSKFVLPFFVRAAIRLFDGSFKHQTIPCLMVPNSGNAPIIYTNLSTSSSTDCTIMSAGVVCDLQYKMPASVLTELQNWKDIITGVSIAVTPPLYVYDPDKEFKETEQYFNYEYLRHETETSAGEETEYNSSQALNTQFSYGRIAYGDNTVYTEDDDGEVVSESDDYKKNCLFTMLKDEGAINGKMLRLVLPEHTSDEISDAFTKASNFHVLTDIKIEDLVCNDKFQTIDLKEKNLMAIPTYEDMVDDVRSGNILSPGCMFVYNSRLNIANITENVWGGFSPSCGCGYAKDENDNTYQYKSVVTVIEEGDTYKVSSDWAYENGDLLWFYYPNHNAKKVTLYRKSNETSEGVTTTVYESVDLELTEHTLLDGAYWFNDISDPAFTYIEDSTEAEKTYTAEVVHRGSIFTSEVTNPFLFPISCRSTIGSGEVLGLSTSAKALSQGQFGQFPLYAFCSDGIWALTVNTNNGAFSSTQPVSRDVVSNADSITQIDDAVVFVTKQGLKIISGSDVQLLSEKIDGLNISEDFFEDSIQSGLYVKDTNQFSDLIQDAKIIYDYPHGLLHIFTDDNLMHYVYDFSTGEFSKQVLDKTLVSAVPGYPISTIQLTTSSTSGNALYRYESLYDDTTTRQGFALTRSYAIGNPLSRKALYDLRTIGQRISADTKFKIAVYISNDNVNWVKLTSLKMKSAKYYRFLVKTDMTDIETLSGIAIQYQERYTDKMR